ncbi:MAG: ABC transporter permease [Crenarchaeota archaeon]|nr:MAG: ABC transporter permease [Thermoproteota archaeon]RDJ34346.1 MAG: ABC transporter permease [Thermoproteota archaeon]RDJ37192.1 MAG: ABC transporter permease [Thermoproteota archaeon]RDJ37928.1 MAG: ABC transporter permease [Thermoproteota archaeon]
MKRYVSTRLITMFGVLMATLLLTVALVGSNMDTILTQGVVFQVRAEITENPEIVKSFSNAEEFESFVQDQIKQRVKTLGLDEPWYAPQRIGLTMFKILTLDFGHATFLTSDSGSSDVKEIILEKLPRTILLFTTATIIISVIGIFLGAVSSSKVGSKMDRLTSSFAIISSSFPVWWIGMMMIFLFAFVYQIFPARATPSISPTDPGYFAALLYHMALPLITIVLIGFGSWAYLVRNFMVGIMQEDFISAKKTMGINQKKIIYRHALKNAAPPIVTILALSLSGSLGGAIITEAVFDWPGMGRLYFEAITVMDLPVIIGATYVLTVFFLISIFVADVLYGYFDPRVRTS